MAFISNAQQKANFKAAEKFSQENLSKMLKSTSVSPNWFKDSDRFWYSYTTSSGKNFYMVDPVKRSKTKLFDNLEFSAKLSELTRRPVNHNNLELDELELNDDNRTLTFQIDSIEYMYDIYNKSLKRGDTIPEEEDNDWASYAPDSSYMVFAKNHNLFIMEVGDQDSVEIHEVTVGLIGGTGTAYDIGGYSSQTLTFAAGSTATQKVTLTCKCKITTI